MDIRQSENWGKYLTSIDWKVEKIGLSQAFIRPIPLTGRSVIKIQHPYNPLPLSKIDELAKKHKALFAIIEPDIKDFKNEGGFYKFGFQPAKMSYTHTATIYINLQRSLKKLLSSFSENARRNIKKSQSNNLQIKTVLLKDQSNDEEFKKFYSLLTNLTKLKKFYVPGYREFYKKMLAFKNNSAILFAFNQDNSQPIAAVWLGFLKDTAIYMNTGITEEGYKFLANYLLVWESFKLAKKMKLKLFDFEGIYDSRFPKYRKSWINFSEFKKRFHGEVIEFPAPFIKYYSLPFKLFNLCSKILSR